MLMATAIVVIAIAMAAPHFSKILKDNALAASGNEFVHALNLARSEAVKRLKNVTVCQSGGNHTACSTTGDWSQGWIAFVDSNGNGMVDGQDTRIHAHGSLPSGQKLSSAYTSVTYASSGRVIRAISLKLCDNRTGNLGKSIGISVTGRVRLSSGVSCP